MAMRSNQQRLDIDEQISRIEVLIIDTQRQRAGTICDRLETGIAPWLVATSGAIVGAAIFAAGAAIVHVII
jgi:hypothetical protein